MKDNSFIYLVLMLLIYTGGTYNNVRSAQATTEVSRTQCEAWGKEFWRALSRHDKKKIILLCNLAQHLKIYTERAVEDIRMQAFIYIESFGPCSLGRIPVLERLFAHDNLIRLLAE